MYNKKWQKYILIHFICKFFSKWIVLDLLRALVAVTRASVIEYAYRQVYKKDYQNHNTYSSIIFKIDLQLNEILFSSCLRFITHFLWSKKKFKICEKLLPYVKVWCHSISKKKNINQIFDFAKTGKNKNRKTKNSMNFVFFYNIFLYSFNIYLFYRMSDPFH